jgi:hypothetical protein
MSKTFNENRSPSMFVAMAGNTTERTRQISKVNFSCFSSKNKRVFLTKTSLSMLLTYKACANRFTTLELTHFPFCVKCFVFI